MSDQLKKPRDRCDASHLHRASLASTPRKSGVYTAQVWRRASPDMPLGGGGSDPIATL